jgi:hypothetical protein
MAREAADGPRPPSRSYRMTSARLGVSPRPDGVCCGGSASAGRADRTFGAYRRLGASDDCGWLGVLRGQVTQFWAPCAPKAIGCAWVRPTLVGDAVWFAADRYQGDGTLPAPGRHTRSPYAGITGLCGHPQGRIAAVTAVQAEFGQVLLLIQATSLARSHGARYSPSLKQLVEEG